jgi:putative hydrolase of the HAD superfamily
MEKDYLQFITEFLGNVAEMKPVPTLLKPYIKKDPSVRAFIFDIYGTLLVSASGDIDESILSTDNLNLALKSSDIQIIANKSDRQLVLSEMLEEFKQLVKDFHDSTRNEDRPYPEVDILQIWEQIIINNQQRNRLQLNGPLCIKFFTFIFEVLSNRIYPMPGMKEVLNHLAAKDFPLGIISNAQFYTPVILNFFMHNSIIETEYVLPFDPDLTFFSYKYMRSKPDSYLFQLLKEQCQRKYGIFDDEILFIGNDLYRDVYPARLAGFKTVLFAGDTKSLRLRQDKPELRKIVPDFIINDLHQLLDIIV